MPNGLVESERKRRRRDSKNRENEEDGSRLKIDTTPGTSVEATATHCNWEEGEDEIMDGFKKKERGNLC